MIFDTFQNSFSTGQQQKILKQIQSINRKLTNSSHITKPSQKVQQEKYFSQQCQQLFKVEFKEEKVNQTYGNDDSLFNSQNQMLLDNYQKEIINFKQFQTNKFGSGFEQRQNIKCKLFSKNPNQLFKIFQSQKQNCTFQSNNIPLMENKNKTNLNFKGQNTFKQTSKSKILVNKSRSQSQIKKVAQSNIKKYIQNKQNSYPAFNAQQDKQKYFIKEVKRKIRFDTQPDGGTQNIKHQRNESDSLQLFNNRQRSSQQSKAYDNQSGFSQKISSQKLKFQTGKNSLQCTFKPNILKKSNQIAENLQPSFQRLTQDIGVSKSQSKIPYKPKQQLTNKKYSAKRMQQLSQPRRLKTQTTVEQQQKPTFRPSLSKKSLQQMVNCTLDVASRNKLWLEQKQNKINRLKIQQHQNRLKKQSGPYAPKINEYKGQAEVHLSRFAKEGISTYFQRISMAKQRKQKFQETGKRKPQSNKGNADDKRIKDSLRVNMKKKTYDQAVKQLHKKIMTMNI